MIELTPNAAGEIRRRQHTENAAGKSLRIFVEKGCCKELQYGLAFDSKVPGDEVVMSHRTQNIEVLVDPHSLPFLSGVTIGFNDGLYPGTPENEFEIFNPQELQGCGEGGCGEGSCGEGSCGSGGCCN